MSRYNPDLILIGCNPLSVLNPDTTFSRQTLIAMKGIIEPGVKLMATNLNALPESKVIVFGTQATASVGTYAHKLTEKGFLPDRFFSQACPDMVPYIDRGYDSDETEMLIYSYVDEALRKVGKGNSPLYVSLKCTRYGYSNELWTKASQSFGIAPLRFLNPNNWMNDFLFSDQKKHRFDDMDVSDEVISMVSIDKQRIDSIGNWLRAVSPQTAEAHRNYTDHKDLLDGKNT